MLNKIKKILGMTYEIDSKIFRKALVQYPYNSDSSGAYIREITSVRAFQNKDNITVVIKSHGCGILIGKQGKQISAIRDLMIRMSGKEVEIKLVEDDMFNHLYE